MIYTASHKNINSKLYRAYAISGNRGSDASWEGMCYPALAPKKEFFKIWHDNIGKISEEENTKYYINEYYKQVLSKLDPYKVYNELDNSILLCYEDGIEFCHRHIVRAWFKLFLQADIKEIKSIGYATTEYLESPDYTDILENVIKENNNMRGFNSIRAWYLFMESEALEQEADYLEAKNGKDYSYLRQSACFRRCDADEAEAEYNIKQKRLNK